MLKLMNLAGTRVGLVALVALALLAALFYAPIIAKETRWLESAPAVEQVVASAEPEAEAAPNCTYWQKCGSVFHMHGSERSTLLVTNNFGTFTQNTNVSRGYEAGYYDDDGFKIPYRCKARIYYKGVLSKVTSAATNYNTWYKVYDGQNAQVRIDC